MLVWLEVLPIGFCVGAGNAVLDDLLFVCLCYCGLVVASNPSLHNYRIDVYAGLFDLRAGVAFFDAR